MKKFFLILLIFLSFNSYAIDELYDISPYNTQGSNKDVGIAKYAVLEVITDYAPIRKNPDENAKRITHLYKDAVLFSDKQNKDYYRIELEKINNKPSYFWINKKYVEVQGVIPEKRFEDIKKITFKNDFDRYNIKIETNTKSAFIIEENKQKLDFTLYDNHFDPTNTKIVNLKDNFTISDKIENKLEISYCAKKPLFGYGVNNFDDGYIYTIKKAPKISTRHPLKHIRVVIDAGHGGSEKGACANHLQEKDLNLQISKKLKRELKKAKAKVYMTRTKDVDVPLYNRVDFAREVNADILLSIHQNSLPNLSYMNKKYGVGTYWYNNQAQPLAYEIEKSLVRDTGFRDDGNHNASFVMTRPTDFVSVLIECGYIIKPDEAKKLADKKFQKLIAKSIRQGIQSYLIKSFSK